MLVRLGSLLLRVTRYAGLVALLACIDACRSPTHVEEQRAGSGSTLTPNAVSVRSPSRGTQAHERVNEPSSTDGTGLDARGNETNAPNASLTGLVREVDGREIRDGVVELTRIPGEGAALPESGRGKVLLELHSDGKFRADDLVPGIWRLTVNDAGRATFTTTVDLARGEQRTLALDLPLGLVVAGRVVDRYGDPVAGVHIRADRAGGAPLAWSTLTDELGRFRLVGFERGDLWLHAFEFVGRASREGPVTMADFEWPTRAGREHVELVQPIERTLTVRVVDARGEPVPGASLYVDRMRGCVRGGPRPLDADGRARITHPEDHELSIQAWPPRTTTGEAIGEPSEARLIRVEDRELEIVLPTTQPPR